MTDKRESFGYSTQNATIQPGQTGRSSSASKETVSTTLSDNHDRFHRNSTNIELAKDKSKIQGSSGSVVTKETINSVCRSDQYNSKNTSGNNYSKGNDMIWYSGGNTLPVPSTLESADVFIPEKIVRQHSNTSDRSGYSTPHEGPNPSGTHASYIERPHNIPGQQMPHEYFAELEFLRTINQSAPDNSPMPTKKIPDQGKPLPKHTSLPPPPPPPIPTNITTNTKEKDKPAVSILPRLLELQNDLALIKESHLSIIHEFDPEFQFLVAPNEEKLLTFAQRITTEENVKKYEQNHTLIVENIDNQFCIKCEELQYRYQVDVSSRETRNNLIKLEIAELESLTSEYDATSHELQEALEQSEKELDIEETVLLDDYMALKSHLKHYFQSQFKGKSESSIQTDVHCMFDILLQEIILIPALKEINVIQDLFDSSGHSNWVLHARKQAVAFMLLQPQSIEIEPIVNLFQTKYKVFLEPDDQGHLAKAIFIAHRFSIYAIADSHYFKHGLTFEGLERFLSSDTRQIDCSSAIKTETSVVTEYPNQTESIEITDSPLQRPVAGTETPLQRPVGATEPTLQKPLETNESLLQRPFGTNDTSKLAQKSSSSLNQKDQILNPSNNKSTPHIRTISSSSVHSEQQSQQTEGDKKQLIEWEKHITTPEPHDCVWCLIHQTHQKMIEAKSDSKSLKSGNSNKKKTCQCSSCRILEEHKKKECKPKHQKYVAKCDQCKKLRITRKELFVEKESFIKKLTPKKSN